MKNSLILLSILFYIGCGESSSSSSSSGDSVSTPIGSGKAGSQAQYQIVGDYLYTVNEGVMDIFDISNPAQPQRSSKIHLPWDVETLFAYKEQLYIGASTGVYIYDNSSPTQPTSIGKFSHVESCDPVVISEDIAYVTLNTSNSCFRNRTGVNRLDIIDVEDPHHPKLIKSVDLWSPTGLAVDNYRLFICDGESGLKAFDINRSDNNGTKNISINATYSNAEINCFDLIADNQTLIVSNHKDIRQFDYSEKKLKELGVIK